MKKWCENTSCHGVADVLQSQNIFGKVFWCVLILGSLGIVSWQVTELVTDFFREPHFRTTTYILDEGTIRFPNVTLCNFNRVDRRKAMALGMTMANDSSKLDPDYLNYLYETLDLFMRSPLGFSFDYRFFGEQTALEKLHRRKMKFDAWREEQHLTQTSLLDLFVMLSLTCRDMVQYCAFRMIPMDCCVNATPIATSYGVCWSLTSLGGRHAEQVGKLHKYVICLCMCASLYLSLSLSLSLSWFRSKICKTY